VHQQGRDPHFVGRLRECGQHLCQDAGPIAFGHIGPIESAIVMPAAARFPKVFFIGHLPLTEAMLRSCSKA
jgi:hypothetical protein